MGGRTITLKVKYFDFQIITRSRTLIAAVTCEKELGIIGIELLAQLMPPLKGVRLLGLTLSNLEAENVAEPSHPQMCLAL